MINNIVTHSDLLKVTDHAPYIDVTNTANPATGMVKYDQFGCLQVYSNSGWTSVARFITIDMSGDAIDAINWVRLKMAEEKELNKLCDTYPALKTAKENFELIKQLVQNENH